ncbi:MAG: hypothetical protein Q8R08_01450 [bacterium]|nr:hypothetical protein [bacterium]
MKHPQHLISSIDIDKTGYDEILRRADKFLKEGIPPHLMEGKVVGTLFFQPSTRTQACFQSAMIRSGGGWLGVTDSHNTSMEKGETLEDTVRTFGGYTDIIILRHPNPEATEIAAPHSRVPVINGGNGNKEHALAAGLLLFNIYHFLGRLDGIKIGSYGTAEFSRGFKASAKILGYYGVEMFIDDLDGNFPLPKDVEEVAYKNGIKSIKYDKLENFIGEVDWLIIPNAVPTVKITPEQDKALKENYKPINTGHMKKLRQDAFLDMITPCVFEIEKDVYPDPRAVFTKKEIHTEYALALMTYFLDVEVK